jgi:hypothetical protein
LIALFNHPPLKKMIGIATLLLLLLAAVTTTQFILLPLHVLDGLHLPFGLFGWSGVLLLTWLLKD